MIARLWTGRVRAADADRYVALMREVAIPDYLSVEGNLGAWCLHRPDAEQVVVTMLTFWRDPEAIHGFAGDPIDRAKYYPFDRDFLLTLPETVEHYVAEGLPPGDVSNLSISA